MIDILLLKTLLETKITCNIIDYMIMPMFRIGKELKRAAARENIETIKYIIHIMNIEYDKDAITYWTYLECALIEAVECGRLSALEYLISAGADIHAFDDYALEIATENNHTDIVDYLINANKISI